MVQMVPYLVTCPSACMSYSPCMRNFTVAGLSGRSLHLISILSYIFPKHQILAYLIIFTRFFVYFKLISKLKYIFRLCFTCYCFTGVPENRIRGARKQDQGCQKARLGGPERTIRGARFIGNRNRSKVSSLQLEQYKCLFLLKSKNTVVVLLIVYCIDLCRQATGDIQRLSHFERVIHEERG